MSNKVKELAETRHEMRSKAAEAKRLFIEEKYNCAQAVACAFCSELELPAEKARALAASFGGGMGRLREVCGAVSGALLVFGAVCGGYDPADRQARPRTINACRNLPGAFRSRMEALSAGSSWAFGPDKKQDAQPEERTAAYYARRPLRGACGLRGGNFGRNAE